MKALVYTGQFKRDYKLAQKRGKNILLLKEVVGELALGNDLPLKNQDHSLTGNYKGCRECHIEPDWLLVYETTDIEITLIRTGSHSDLF